MTRRKKKRVHACNPAKRQKEQFTCSACGSHNLQMCLLGRVGCAEVESIGYEPETWDPAENEREEIEIETAHVSVQTLPDGTEAWSWGVDNQDDAYSCFRCSDCCYVLRSETGDLVESEEDLVRWILKQNSASKADQGN